MRTIDLIKTGVAALTLTEAGFGTAQAQSGPELSYEQIKADIALAEKAYKRVHPGYARYASAEDMADAWDALEMRAKDGMSTNEFYLGVQQVLTEIRCDHTKAELPKSLIELRKETPVYLPIRWNVVEGRGLVRSASEETGLKYGDEILAIDGRPLSEMMDEVDDYIPVDGYTEWSKNAGISESLEFRGGAVDHFGALLWDIKPTAEITISNPKGTQRTITVDRVHFDAWTALGQADGFASDFKDAVTFNRIGDKGAYLRVDTFVNYRNPVDVNEIYDPIFDALKAEHREYLILDLRQNGGGSNDASSGLLNKLMPETKTFNKDVRVATLNLDGLRDHLSTWDKSALNPPREAFIKNDDGSYSFQTFAGQHGLIEPADNGFKGKLIVLTSHQNSSGSAAVLAHLKDADRATFIGENAGGSAEGPTAGLLFYLNLPESGMTARIPAIRAFHNIESFEEGLSISPDINVPMTVKAFRDKRDPAMEAAMKYMEQE